MSIYAKSGLGVRAPEATQFIQAQAGCSKSLNHLMARHDGLVQAVVRQQVLGELPFEEALQAGRIGLWRAILGFDPERGFTFSTYAWPAIKHRIWRAVKGLRVRCPRHALQFMNFGYDAYCKRVRELADLDRSRGWEYYESWTPYRL